MIYTVFSTSTSEAMQWQSELLEYSWGRVRQPGELVRLVAAKPGEQLPRHRFARVVRTLNWSPHPYTGDAYSPYNKAASLLEWLFAERIDGTCLVLEPDSVFLSPVATEIDPGQARASAWLELPHGEGPFGLGPDFAFLEQYCVDRTLTLPAVRPPLLIHSSDLRRIVARWLELMGIIRSEMSGSTHSELQVPDAVAYGIAAAEADVPHTHADLGGATDAAEGRAPILHYRRPVEASGGEILWDPSGYRAWDAVEPELAGPGVGRDFLALLAEFVGHKLSGSDLALVRPCRRKGVREGRVFDHTLLEIPGRADTLSLNSSGAAIWDLCDGRCSMAELTRKLEAQFQMQSGSLDADIQQVIERLVSVGALELEPI